MMRKSTIFTIIYLLIDLAIIVASIILGEPVIFFAGLIIITALHIIFSRFEQRKIISYLLNFVRPNDNISAINYLKSKDDKCFFYQSNIMIKVELVYRYLAIDDFENLNKIINSNKLNNLKQIVYAKFILAVINGNIKCAEEYQKELSGLNIKKYRKQIDMSFKILNMIKNNTYNQEVYNTTNYNCIKRVCEQIKEGNYKITQTEDSIEVNRQVIISNKKINSILIIFFVLSIASIFMALGIVAIFVNTSLLPTFPLSMVEYMWMFYLFIPIPLASIVLGVVFKRKGYKCKKNIIVGCIMTPLLFLYGCFWIKFYPSITHDTSYIVSLSNTISITIPSDSYVSIVTDYNNYEYLMMVKISENKTENFVNNLEYNGWKKIVDLYLLI